MIEKNPDEHKYDDEFKKCLAFVVNPLNLNRIRANMIDCNSLAYAGFLNIDLKQFNQQELNVYETIKDLPVEVTQMEKAITDLYHRKK